MSNQDPPFGNPANSSSTEDRPFGTPAQGEGVIPAGDAAKLREAGETVRQDFNSALETARNDLRALADTAKRDFSAVKDEAVTQLQGLRGQAAGNAQSLKAQAGDQLQSLKGQAQDQIQSLKGEAEGRLNEAADRAKSYASEQANQLADQARSFATAQKDLAARQFGGVVDAVSKVADELQSSQQGSAVAGYAQDFAGGLRGLADTIQNKSVDELFSLVQDFGKRQPLAFLGIAALTGFAASRFILASRQRDARPAGGLNTYADDTFTTDRAFDDEVLAGQGYAGAGRTEVELDRPAPDFGNTNLNTRGVGDNGRI